MTNEPTNTSVVGGGGGIWFVRTNPFVIGTTVSVDGGTIA